MKRFLFLSVVFMILLVPVLSVHALSTQEQVGTASIYRTGEGPSLPEQPQGKVSGLQFAGGLSGVFMIVLLVWLGFTMLRDKQEVIRKRKERQELMRIERIARSRQRSDAQNDAGLEGSETEHPISPGGHSAHDPSLETKGEADSSEEG